MWLNNSGLFSASSWFIIPNNIRPWHFRYLLRTEERKKYIYILQDLHATDYFFLLSGNEKGVN